MKKRPKAKNKVSTQAEVRVRGSRAPMFGDELVVVRRGQRLQSERTAKRSEAANELMKKVGWALNKPGIKHSVVFRRSHNSVFAYSIDPRDPNRIIRQSSIGKKTVGRFVDGRFKAN